MKVKNLRTNRIVEINETILADLINTKRINCVKAEFELVEDTIESPKIKKEYNSEELLKLTKDKLIYFIENEININFSEEDKELTKKELINKFLK